MKGFYFDLLAPPRGLNWVRTALVLAGAVALAAAVAYWQLSLYPRLDAQRELVRAEITRLGQARGNTNNLNTKELSLAWQRAREASVQLNLPWAGLFAQVGSAAKAGNVALMAIEPDAQRSQVALVAEARNLDAMLEFVKAMQASPDFSDVTLQSHSISKTVSEQPVRFHVAATWRTTE